MMQIKKTALHPRMLSSLFFIVYALLFSLFIRFTIYPLLNKIFYPLIPRLTTVLLTAALLGFLFSPLLQKKGHWFRFFCIGVLMAICAILLTSLVVYFYAWHNGAHIFQVNRPMTDYFVIYGSIVAILTSAVGIWLLPLTGLVVIYFNKRFLPSLLHIEQKTQKSSKATLPKHE